MPAWSGMWDGVFMTPYSGPIGKNNPSRRLRRAVRGLGAMKTKELLRSLVNGAVGDAAAAGHKRVTAVQQTSAGSLGGVRPIETVLDISRVTTTADRDALLNDILNVHTPVFPTEKSGNSGGGKLGF